MSDEIKEILREAKEYRYIDLNTEKTDLLLDYITNLQEENERLKELNENASKVCMAEHRYGVDKAEEARDYKSRCEKGLDKLYCYGEVFDSKILQEFQKEMINILTGGDKE